MTVARSALRPFRCKCAMADALTRRTLCAVIKCCDPDPDRASLYELYQRWWKQFYFLPLHAEHVSGRLAELCILGERSQHLAAEAGVA